MLRYSSPRLRVSFQLTPSRRATLPSQIIFNQIIYFNSRPHGGRPRRCGGRHNRRYFNSRPHGGRHTSKELAPRRMVFQLTPSRRATEAGGIFVLIFKISTHALTEGDVISPRNTAIGMLFQLTPSRRATMESSSFFMFSSISTHALTEGDALLT